MLKHVPHSQSIPLLWDLWPWFSSVQVDRLCPSDGKFEASLKTSLQRPELGACRLFLRTCALAHGNNGLNTYAIYATAIKAFQNSPFFSSAFSSLFFPYIQLQPLWGPKIIGTGFHLKPNSEQY